MSTSTEATRTARVLGCALIAVPQHVLPTQALLTDPEQLSMWRLGSRSYGAQAALG